MSEERTELIPSAGSAERTLRRVCSYLDRKELEHLVYENEDLESLPQWLSDLRRIISQNVESSHGDRTKSQTNTENEQETKN